MNNAQLLELYRVQEQLRMREQHLELGRFEQLTTDQIDIEEVKRDLVQVRTIIKEEQKKDPI